MMFDKENQIADFRQSVYQNDYGFDVTVCQNEDGTVSVTTTDNDNLLEKNYDNFEDFLNDLIKKNPLWFTYYYVRIIPAYRDLVKEKLTQSYREAFNWLNLSLMSTSENWCFDKIGLGDFSKNTIQALYNSDIIPDINPEEPTEEEPEQEKRELSQMWNGYCPESWLKGKQVRMRLNRNDFFESEETGLQIAVLGGVQAIILNFRGVGDFRTNPDFADDIENGEMLSPQNTNSPPFNNPPTVFDTSLEIENYIDSIP